MKYPRLTLRLLLLLAALTVAGTKGRAAAPAEQGLWLPSLRTLHVVPERDPLAPPVVNLAVPGDVVRISFDELADSHRYLRYSLEHCDAQWRPEGLVDSEFMDSFNEENIDDYAHSQATVVGYVNYTFTAPGPGMRLTAPGNYLVKVWDERDPDTLIATARIGVCDYSVPISAEVSPVTDIDARGAHQQLSLRLDTRHLDLADPYTDLKIVVSQNDRPDTERLITVPSRRVGPDLIYEHQRDLIFPAGNEYRRFDMASVDYPGLGVETIDHETPVYNVMLRPDTPRRGEHYLYDSTQHGAFVTRTVEADADGDHDTRADYALTLFTLSMPPLPGADIYVEGDLTGRRYTPSSRMVYNHDLGRYELALLLKQGAYNYQYVAVPHGSPSGTGLTDPVEGDKWETLNRYTIKVYHRPRGSRFDRLVGFTTVESAPSIK
ncbi:MAG: DUF5103 domain-containing protein [Duncaniella sp.]|nr:DUF5103 domain-containing protein [Duncaniella sp.]